MKTSQAEIIREYGPFEGARNVGGVTYDGSRVWFAAGENLRALDPESGAGNRNTQFPIWRPGHIIVSEIGAEKIISHGHVDPPGYLDSLGVPMREVLRVHRRDKLERISDGDPIADPKLSRANAGMPGVDRVP